jgi:hypothetical protein
MISMAVHRNLLRLRGFCMTPTERLLVYPYMANGSVASRLRGTLSCLRKSCLVFYLCILASYTSSTTISNFKGFVIRLFLQNGRNLNLH